MTPTPKPKDQLLGIRVTALEKHILKMMAAKDQTTIQDIIHKLITEHLKTAT